MENIVHWFEQYSYFVLFFGLIADFVLPFPAEAVMAYAGYLSSVDTMHWLPSMLLAFLGTSTAITASYGIGYAAGVPFIERYGKWLFLKPSMVDRTKKWFDKYGNKLLLISFFIPAGRQFSGYFAGIIRIPFRTFALYSYTGALLWVIVYVGIGYLLGPHWQDILDKLKHYSGIIAVATVGIGGAWAAVRRIRSKRISHASEYGKQPDKSSRPADS